MACLSERKILRFYSSSGTEQGQRVYPPLEYLFRRRGGQPVPVTSREWILGDETHLGNIQRQSYEVWTYSKTKGYPRAGKGNLQETEEISFNFNVIWQKYFASSATNTV